MVPLLRLFTAALVLTVSSIQAQSVGSYEPYLDDADLYRMQLLSNAFGYPEDSLPEEGSPYGMMDVDKLMDFDNTNPQYWPVEVLAALAAGEEGDANVLGDDLTEEETTGISNDLQEADIEDGQDEQQEEQQEGEGEDEAAVEEVEAKLAGQKVSKDSGAQIRDQEHLEHSALHGFQSVSGGTVNGQSKETKTDKALPAYCNPPNPCPVGKTADDNCVENFENSADNNQRLLSEQECPCDTEHMFTCPEGSQTVSSKPQSGTGSAGAAGVQDPSQQMELNRVISELSNMDQESNSLENNPSISSTHKRVTLVAKKSPNLARHKRSEVPDSDNPFLQGEELKIAAKKSPESRNVFGQWEMQ